MSRHTTRCNPMSEQPKIIFFGTPDLAVYVLEELSESGIVPSLVVTAPDKPVGRKLIRTAPPVKVWAEQHGVPVVQPASLKDPARVPELTEGAWDGAIVAAYALMIPAWLLARPRRGMLNVHPSLLPALRGPSPIRTALRDNVRDAVGVSIIMLDEAMDHGPIVVQERTALPRWPMRGRDLDELLFRAGGRMLIDLLPAWFAGTLSPVAQDDAQATFTTKFVKEDGELRATDTDAVKYAKYCAMDGWPGTYFFHTTTDAPGNTTTIRVKVTEADLVNGVFTIRRVVPEGKREVAWSEWSGRQ